MICICFFFIPLIGSYVLCLTQLSMFPRWGGWKDWEKRKIIIVQKTDTSWTLSRDEKEGKSKKEEKEPELQQLHHIYLDICEIEYQVRNSPGNSYSHGLCQVCSFLETRAAYTCDDSGVLYSWGWPCSMHVIDPISFSQSLHIDKEYAFPWGLCLCCCIALYCQQGCMAWSLPVIQNSYYLLQGTISELIPLTCLFNVSIFLVWFIFFSSM